MGRAVRGRLSVLVVTTVMLGGACGGDGPDGRSTSSANETSELPGVSLPDEAGTDAMRSEPEALRLSSSGIGELRLGMSISDAVATGLVSAQLEPRCDLFDPPPRYASLMSPLSGSAVFDGDTLTSVVVTGGVSTDPGGIEIGASLDEFTEGFEEEGWSVEVDYTAEELFGTWYANATTPDGGAFIQASVDPESTRIDELAIPAAPTCE